jgi:membrane-associated protease RseP (regulator of RpoE activity)
MPFFRRYRGAALACAALALLLLPARREAGAEEARPPWAGELDALRGERDGAKRAAGVATLLAKKPDVNALLVELARPRVYATGASRGTFQWDREVPGVGALTVFAYAPSGYTSEKAWPVLVWMHGGVGRDEDGGGLSGLGMLQDVAEAEGFLLLSPSATGKCPWWSPAGARLLHGALLDLAATHRVDATRVAAAGFSDGGSGCFHLLAHAPDSYGCFVALMGNPNITRIAGGPVFASNLASRPVWALNGGRDQLYPSAQMKPAIEELQRAGARLAWEDDPAAGHDPGAALGRLQAVFDFWAKNPREALPATLDWSSAAPAVDGRRGWLEIVAVSPDAPGDAASAAVALPPPQAPRRPRLGITLDQEFEGVGIRLTRVEPGSPAADAGFQPGDVLVKVGDRQLTQGGEALATLRAYLDGLGESDGAFGVLRGDETLTLTTRPRLLKSDEPPAELGYGRPAGRVVGEIKPGNQIVLTTHGVSSLRLHLARPLVDPTKPVTVTLNGKQVHSGPVQGDAAYVLEQALTTLPGDPYFEATLTLAP